MSLTPRQLGYRMPAEWEPHAATWLSWPHKQESWPGKFAPIPGIFLRIVEALSPHECVCVNVRDESMEAEVRRLLERQGVSMERVRLCRIPTDDAWCRDHGPIFLVREDECDRELAAVDWKYNAWGGKYPPYELDNRVPEQIATLLGIRRFSPGMILEGGSIEVNGHGSLLTTESCLLNPNRNPELSRSDIEQCLRDYLGVSQILWLGEGIEGDDTDGHIDDLARFVNPRTIATVIEEDFADANYRPLRDNLRRLHSMQDLNGRPFEIVTLPMPPPSFCEGQRLPMSYANFYIANGVVLVPLYDPSRDGLAMESLAKLFPDRKLVGIDAKDLVWGLGAFHCVTQQQPQTSRTHLPVCNPIGKEQGRRSAAG